MTISAEQLKTCEKYGASPLDAPPHFKAGVAANVVSNVVPVNGLALIRALVVGVCLLPLAAMNAAERYRVTLAPGGDSVAIAKRLAAVYHGQLETPVDESGTFLIALSSATAGLLARDPQVAQFQAPAVAPDAAATPWSLGPYEYDDAGNIRKIGASLFVYDSESRLSYEKIGTQKPQAVTYDGFGNIRTITEGSTLHTPGADPATNRAGYGTYDGAGNMIAAGTHAYTFDALNVVTKSTTDASRAYVYNANDERIGVITLTGTTESSSQWTIRDPSGQVLRRFSREGGQWRWLQDYIYRDGKMLASESNDAIKTLHYHLDHLGTPRLITGNGGAEVARHTYYPFGEEAPGPTPQVAEPKKFTGHERDAGGIDYMHARYYDYGMGRFLSVDPVFDVEHAKKNSQGWNRYLYVENNPMNATDPNGQCSSVLSCGGWGIGAVGGALGITVRLIGTAAAMYVSRSTEPVRPLAVPPVLSEGVNWGPKIDKQLGKRGWDVQSVHDAINNPDRTYDVRDQRHLPGGVTVDQPATAYVNDDGSYVIVNDVTGEVVQVSDRNDPNWLNSWDTEKPERQRDDPDDEMPPQ